MSAPVRNQVDMARRDGVMRAVDCSLCGAEAGEDCTGWKDQNSHALHNQRWLAARTNQSNVPPKAVTDAGTTTSAASKRVSDEILALIVVEAKTHEIDALVNQYGFRWKPTARAYVKLLVGDRAGAKKLARQMFDAGYAIKLHAARPHEIVCWEQHWGTFNNGNRDVVRKSNL